MKKPALRENRMKKSSWVETNWTKSSKSLGQYIFRRLSIDQSDKELGCIRPRHNLSQLIVQAKEIDKYVSDYFALQESKRSNIADTVSVGTNYKNLVAGLNSRPQS
tara:strand:- start:171 stop:488 length:318 start_codon:yes stop_codon:yes gene_type:complete